MSDSYAAVWRTPWPDPYHFAVAMVLARYSGPDGRCGLRMKAIARLAHCSERQAQKVLAAMREHKPPRIEVEETKRGDGSQGANIIRLTLSANVDTENDTLVTILDFYPEEAELQAALRKMAVSRATGRKGGAADAPPPTAKRAPLKESEENSEGNSKESGAYAQIQAMFESYNQVAQNIGLAIATKITDKRRKRLSAIWSEYGAQGWAEALNRLQRSKFLRGCTMNGAPIKDAWRADLDFLLQASSFQKLIEGGYGAELRPMASQAEEDARTRAAFLMQPQLVSDQVREWRNDRGTWPRWLGPEPGAEGCIIPHQVQRAHGVTPWGQEPAAGVRVVPDMDLREVSLETLPPPDHDNGEDPAFA